MTLAEDINFRGRGCLRVVAALVAAMLMAPVAGASATGAVGAPGTLLATGINDSGTIVGLSANPDATPDDQRSPMRMPMMSNVATAD
jgi:hypothetical protein